MDFGYLINAFEHQSTSGTKIARGLSRARALMLNYSTTEITVEIVIARIRPGIIPRNKYSIYISYC